MAPPRTPAGHGRPELLRAQAEHDDIPLRRRQLPTRAALLLAAVASGPALCRHGPPGALTVGGGSAASSSGGAFAAPSRLATRGRGRAATARGAAAVDELGSRVIGDDRHMDSAVAWGRIEQLRLRMRRHPDLPRFRGRSVADNDSLLWWFLRERRMDVGETAQKLERFLRWRQEFRIEKLGPELFTRELRARKAYLHRHNDLAGRPVLVAIGRRHNVMERKLQDSCRMCAWYMERALEKLDMRDPPVRAPRGAASQRVSHAADTTGPAEQALGIFDLRGFSPLQWDPEFVLFLIDALYNYYPGRVARVLLVGAPDIFTAFWETVRPLLGRYAALADFVSAEDVRRRYFAPGLAPPEFEGGS
uniref:CRAL-TRIO domain-containing protein n=1 Tax=Alexandrium catenella TaxID=2925 RepID=A0A7S1PZT7_ALECA